MKKQLDIERDARVHKLTEEPACRFLCHNDRVCGRRHGQIEKGSRITLEGVWDGWNFKGYVCSKHKPQLPKDRTYTALRATAELIEKYRMQSSATTNPPTNHVRRNDKQNRRKRRRGGKGRCPKRQSESKPQAAEPQNEAKTAPDNPQRSGEGLRRLVPPKHLGFYEAALRRAHDRAVPLVSLLASTVRGRSLLAACGLSKWTQTVAKSELQAIADLNVAARMRIHRHMSQLRPLRECDA